jgi:hypothetical protein
VWNSLSLWDSLRLWNSLGDEAAAGGEVVPGPTTLDTLFAWEAVATEAVGTTAADQWSETHSEPG